MFDILFVYAVIYLAPGVVEQRQGHEAAEEVPDVGPCYIYVLYIYIYMHIYIYIYVYT